MKAPFPYFGGKSRIAGEVWRRFGDVTGYIEPFFGSGAVLLCRPLPFAGVETVNDADGLLCNFWRAVQADPEKVAHYADWPVNECDLHARHMWLVERKESLQTKLEGDPDLFDAKAAGWWCWGMCCWIGSGFCSGAGPWGIEETDGVRKLVHLGGAGKGVNRKRVHLGDAGKGVNRQRVHLGDAGKGVNRQLVHLGDAGKGDAGSGVQGILAWMQALAERLRRVRVCCGDWRRVCGGKSGDALRTLFNWREPGSRCAVFLDPPYADTAKRTASLYRVDSLSTAHEVREWAVEHGDNPRLRIALCGYEGEHKLRGWKCIKGKSGQGHGYGGQAKNGYENRGRERIWFSPHCVDVRGQLVREAAAA